MAQELAQHTSLHYGKYKILRVLGYGGFGITYLALDTEYNKKVAIKEYFPKIWCHRNNNSTTISITHDEYKDFVLKGKQRFLKEAKNLNKLNNPDIVKVYSAFEENHTAYYVMEYIEGITLAKKIESKGKLNPHDAIHIMDQLCAAVDYIHSLNMTHYDLKPQNIMIRENNGKPVIIDFGLSKQYDHNGDATSTMMFAHSAGYSGIELYGNSLTENIFSPQTDVYSLGAIMYFMLKGQKPPEATVLQNTLLPSTGLSEYVYEVIRKAMAYSRNNRYSNVSLFINDLDKAVKGINPLIDDETSFGTTTQVGDNTNYANNRETQSSRNYNSAKRSDSNSRNGIKNNLGIIILAFAVIAGIIIWLFVDNNKSAEPISEKGKGEGIVEVTVKNPIQEIPKITETPKIQTYAERKFTLSGYGYNEQYSLKADNGILYVSSIENGQRKSDQFKYKSNVDAEKILDQFEGLANFWAAAIVGEYIINDNGFYSEEIMKSTLNFLKQSMNYMSSNKGDCPAAYQGAKKRYDMLRKIHKDWQNSSSFKEEWESEIEQIIWGMGESPITAKDISGL